MRQITVSAFAFPVAACAAALIAAGCTPQPTPSSFARNEVGTEQTVRLGEIESVRPVNIRPGQTHLGAITGGALGAIGGSQIGGGTAANVAGGVGGAAAGAMVGSALQGSQSTAGLELTVKLDDGSTIAVVQPGTPNDFRIGDRVRVTGQGENVRVNR
ncbi:hypothetical protein [Caulobacter sp. 17J65-9]|uniref:outer membrane lipoprotein n=1 Tax=Caulobacter sp. 17J65-9 TaxID=2709382 RepID=UPI0013C86F8F|nr:hypothetical protein [Caulobacter sp. 17J65-9]NEX92223.1 hypothetical protein [Caulobacter sp. 17J65-9]